jgi:hypothetical protein
MANEITLSGSLLISATNFRESFNPGTLSIDLSDVKGDGGVQAISHSGSAAQGEAFGVTDVSNGGVFFFRNLDSTNFVEIGFQVSSTFYPFLKLLAGEYAIGRIGTAAPFGRADTANVNVQYRILSP